MRMLLAILLGNLIYFAAEPFLPRTFAHGLYKMDPGLVLDFGVCAAIYRVFLRKRS